MKPEYGIGGSTSPTLLGFNCKQGLVEGVARGISTWLCEETMTIQTMVFVESTWLDDTGQRT